MDTDYQMNMEDGRWVDLPVVQKLQRIRMKCPDGVPHREAVRLDGNRVDVLKISLPTRLNIPLSGSCNTDTLYFVIFF